jgi:2-oxoglutarate ferredoxin oxidoreductase subunit delta
MAQINPARKPRGQAQDKELPFTDQRPHTTKTKYKVEIAKDKCKGCELCIHYCVFDHLEASDDLNKRGVPYAKKKSHTDCKGCGACFLVCPECCIELYEYEEESNKE